MVGPNFQIGKAITDKFLQLLCRKLDIEERSTDVSRSSSDSIIGLTKFRKFEYLAATKLDLTRAPGDDSFTSALIYALETLVEDGRFTTVDLLKKINDAPKFPKDQDPVLSNRNRNNTASAGRIMLHPLPEAGSRTQTPIKEETIEDSARRQVLTLNFEFDEKPTAKQTELLAEDINEMFERNSVKVNGVRWGSMQSKAVKAAAPFIQSLRRIRSNSGSQRLSAPIDILRSHRPRTPDSLVPPTPSSTSPNSPQIQISVDSDCAVFDVPALSPSYLTRPADSDEQSESPTKRLRQR